MVKSINNKNMNMGIIVEAKQEYTRQLITSLQPIVYEAIMVLYSTSVTNSEDESEIMALFGNELKNIPKWNNDVISSESDRIKESCEYIEDLLTAVVLSNVKILTSIRLGRTKKKTKVVIPPLSTFVHNTYSMVGKRIIGNMDLFDIDKYKGNITNNINDVYEIIETVIQDTIRELLPLKNILQSYLGESEEDDSGSDGEEFEENVPMEETPIESLGTEQIPDMPTSDPTEETHNGDKSFLDNVLGDSDDDEIKEVPISQKGKESDIVPPLETTEPIDEIEPDTKPRPSFID